MHSHILVFSLFLSFLYSTNLFSQNNLSFIQKAYDENNVSLARKSIDYYFLEHSGEVSVDAWLLKGDIYATKGMNELVDRKFEAQESFRIARYSFQKGLEAGSFSLGTAMNGKQVYESKLNQLYHHILSEANGFYLQNELDWTIRAAQWAMAVKPEGEKAYEVAVNSALEIRDFPRALKSIENALLQFPTNKKYLDLKKDCLSGMVNTEASKGAWKDVRDHLIELVELDPQNGDFHFNLGMAYHKLGEDSRAIEQLVFSTRLNPDDYISYYYLAKIQYQKALAMKPGDTQKDLLQKAKLYLQIGHQIHPRQPAINDLMDEIGKLLR